MVRVVDDLVAHLCQHHGNGVSATDAGLTVVQATYLTLLSGCKLVQGRLLRMSVTTLPGNC